MAHKISKLCETYEANSYPLREVCSIRNSHVYLFRNSQTGLCKIGISQNPLRRLSQLQNSSGVKLQSLIVIELEQGCDETAEYLEKYLHSYYNSKRKFGEWFDLSIRDILEIRFLFHDVICGYYIFDDIDEHIFKSRSTGKLMLSN